MRILTVFIALTLVPSCTGLFGIFGRKQRETVKGVVECHGKPAEGVKIKLLTVNWLYSSTLDEAKLNNTGKFDLNGTERSVFTLDPRLFIYHTCHRSKASKCKQYRTKLIVPHQNFTMKGSIKEINFDFGKIPLESPLLYTTCYKW